MSIQKYWVAVGVVLVVLCVARVDGAIVAPLDGATEFHYLFVTSGATSPRQSPTTTYSFYHDFASQQVALNPSLSSQSNSWYPIVSTYAEPYGDGHDVRSGVVATT